MMEFSVTYQNRAQTSYLNVYDLKTKQTSVLKKFDHVAEAPLWTADGNGILYNCEGLIYRYDVASGETSVMDTGDVKYCTNDHVLASDGTAIAVSGNVENTIASKIYIIRLDNAEVKEVVSAPFSYIHGWSPDKKTLIYCAGRMQGDAFAFGLYSCPAEGGDEVALADASVQNDGCEYTPDGKTIWYNSLQTGLMQLWKMNADGTEKVQMTFDEDRNAWFPHVSPDGKNVVYMAYNAKDMKATEHEADKNVELRLIPSEGGEPVTLVKLFGGQGTLNANPWSPDNSKIAFFSYEA